MDGDVPDERDPLLIQDDAQSVEAPTKYNPALNVEPRNFTALLATALVSPTTMARMPPPAPEPGPSQFTQGELVNRAIESMLRSGMPNVLSLGYRQIRDQSTHCLPGTRGVENHFPNTLVNEVKRPAWESLLMCTGDALMTWLLTSLYVFVPLPNGCFYQLIGPPATDLARPAMLSRDSFVKSGIGNTGVRHIKGPGTGDVTLDWLLASAATVAVKNRKRKGEIARMEGRKMIERASGRWDCNDEGTLEKGMGVQGCVDEAAGVTRSLKRKRDASMTTENANRTSAKKRTIPGNPAALVSGEPSVDTLVDLSTQYVLPPSKHTKKSRKRHPPKGKVPPSSSTMSSASVQTLSLTPSTPAPGQNPKSPKCHRKYLGSAHGFDASLELAASSSVYVDIDSASESDGELCTDLVTAPEARMNLGIDGGMGLSRMGVAVGTVEGNEAHLLAGARKMGITTSLTFARSRIFYARPTRGVKGTILVGLPKHHVLNRLNPQSMKPTHLKWSLISSVFPRQTAYSLGTPLPALIAAAADPHVAPHLTQKSVTAIAVRKIPWRLKVFGKMVGRLVRGVHGCNFGALMAFYCPNMEVPQVSSHQSQSSVDLLQHTVPYRRVVAYVSAIVNKVFPKTIWGTDANRHVIERFIVKMVQLRRFETLTLQDLIQDFSTSFHVTESAPMKNRVFYFRHDTWQKLAEPLMEILGTTNFEEVSLSEVGNIIFNRSFGFSFVRMLPKESGARPIMNLKRKFTREEIVSALMPKKPSQRTTMYPAGPPSSKLPSLSSVNGTMSNAFHVLTLEKSRNPELFGGSVLGMNEIYASLKSFRQRLQREAAGGGTSHKLPKLFFAKVDVKAAFDSLTHTKLLEILNKILTLDEYIVQKYSMIYPSAGQIKKTYVKKAGDANDFMQFSEFSAGLAQILRNAVFVDQVVYPYELRDELIQLVEEHIRNNIVKMGKKFYRQIVGIPQGSVLSSLLCSFFYGDLERNVLSFTTGDDGVRIRECTKLKLGKTA
ncbi:hypothetical protein HDU93_008150 [Gonapodya sp. JEL0774]|nr:hypothetical protein HDU93_008150 [Gonapodya sp. JEL0774]